MEAIQTILKLVPELRRKFKDTTIIATVEVPRMDELNLATSYQPDGACGDMLMTGNSNAASGTLVRKNEPGKAGFV